MATSTIPNLANKDVNVSPFVYRGIMGIAPFTSTSFNDYASPGTYRCNVTTNFTASPGSGDNGFLVVLKVSSDKLTQLWFGAYLGVIKKRTATVGSTVTWTAWTTASFS